MGRDFYDADPVARELFERTSRLCGRDLVSILFSGPEEALHENLAAQAGVYLVSTLACRAMKAEGLRPPATAGYSLGNYAALCAAGAISYDEGLEVLVAVWRETERLGIRGAMGAVVGARREAVEGVCERLRGEGRLVWIGNVNSATQFVLTGQEEAVAAALEALSPRALTVLPLSMSWPIHSELMEPVAAAIAPVVSRLRTICDPVVPFYGPEGTVVATASQVRRLLGTEFCYPTLWNASFQGMVEAGMREFVEVGPGDMLCKISRWIDRSTRCVPGGTLEAARAAADIFRS